MSTTAARAALWAPPPANVEAVDVGDLRLYVDRDDAVVGRSLMTGRSWEPFESLLFSQIVRPGMTVADIGAHVGLYTLIAASCVGSDGRVFAFEPDPANAALLRQNVVHNGFEDRVAIIEVALADTSGSRPLYYDLQNRGNHSLAEDNVRIGAPSTDVATATLAEAIAEHGDLTLDAAKIDVQGAECLVFAGAGPLFGHRGFRCLLEFWPRGLRQMGCDPHEFLLDLRDMGFHVHAIDPTSGERMVVRDMAAFVAGLDGPLDQVNLFLERS